MTEPKPGQDPDREYRQIRAHGIEDPIGHVDVGPRLNSSGDPLRAARPVVPPTPPVPFRELHPAARAGVVFAVLALLGVAVVVLGLLAWAAVAVWGQVLA